MEDQNSQPDRRRTETHRFILSMVLVLGLLMLAGMIALGHVEEKSSFGLTPLLLLLSPVSQALANWAFPRRNEEKDESEGPKE